MDSRLTVIIPNYNGLKFLPECLDSLVDQSFPCFDVLIVDNGSCDGSVEYLNDFCLKDSRFRVLFLKNNLGFAGGVNAGIEHTLKCRPETKYVILLNNDTKADRFYIESLLNVMDSDTSGRLFAVSPLMLKYSDPGLIDDAGDGYCLVGWAFQRGTDQSSSSVKYLKQTEVFSACAGGSVYRADILDSIRLSPGEYFDNAHFAYLEDIDLSFRARMLGYRIVYEPGATVYHVGSGTSGSKYNDFKVRLAARNNVFVNYKNQPFFILLINLPFILAGVIAKQIFFSKKGFGKSFALGFIEGIKNIPTLKKKKTHFSIMRLPFCIRTEFFMFRDCFSYLSDYLSRHLH